MRKATATVEDYLAVILTLERDNIPATGTLLASHLNVSAPTVTNTFKRMIRDGWIVMDEFKQVTLTAQGRTMAESITRRHMLTEWMLTDSLQVPWSETHLESHQIEHAISPKMEDRLQAKKGSAKTCPHGNPLPGNEDLVSDWVLLTRFAEGESGILRRVHEFGEDSPDLLKFLEQKNFLPGTPFTVKEILSFNETITIETDKFTFSLGQAVCQYLYAEREEKSPGKPSSVSPVL